MSRYRDINAACDIPVIFAYKDFKINKNLFLNIWYFESVFVKPNKFYINIYNHKLSKKLEKIAFFVSI